MAAFDPICRWVLEQEDRGLTGVVKDLGDGQGLTRLGVGQKAHPELSSSFYTIPAEQAIPIAEGVYRNTYWNRFQGDAIVDTGVASCLLSFAINDGTSREVKSLQKVLGLEPDGVFGPQTLVAVNSSRPDALAAALRAAQGDWYRFLAPTHPVIARDLRGLLLRVSRVYPSLL